jgi:D-alanine-D-alanine ligase
MINLAVIFGARSAEHEVSIISAVQALDWIDKKKYKPYLIYLDHDNNPLLCKWPRKKDLSTFIEKTIKNDNKIEFVKGGIKAGKLLRRIIKIDVALLIMHGAFGEDGKIQGLLDFYDIPYTGCGVSGSVLGMDKVLSKELFAEIDLPACPFVWFWDNEFEENKKKTIKTIEKKLKYPIFVKPANCGSSVGITKVKNRNELEKAIKKASKFDHKILLEQGIEQSVDINCAVMGGYELKTSVCEQPIIEDEFLSFQEKYLKGGKTKGMAGLSRIVPAPIPDNISKKIQEAAKIAFREIGAFGMARIDFLYQPKTKKFYINEINTIPGSLAFYLWQASGVEPKKMLDEMVSIALERKKENASVSFSFRSKILEKTKL